jgi:DNA ligase (NAD+)
MILLNMDDLWRQRIHTLTQFLSHCDQRYFLYNQSPIGDGDYDLLTQELENLKKAHGFNGEKPIFKNLTPGTTKVKHQWPMLSLQKVYEKKDIIDFFKKSFDPLYANQKGYGSIIMELKIDGVSVSLIYEGGLFVQGLSRGDGVVGEDITSNIFEIPSIPLMIKDPSLANKTIVIRGELYIKKSYHQKYFNHQIHPRNICAGLIRKKHLDEEGQYINFFAYNILNYPLDTQKEVLNQLNQWGMPIEDNNEIITNENQLNERLDHWQKAIHHLDYECDGVVLKMNNCNLFNTMGNTISHPRAAVAFKFANKKKTTFIESIQWQVGKNGRIIPVATVNPVVIDGVTIKKVTLHNYDFVKNLKNKTVIIERAGGVIPKVIKIDATMADDMSSIIIIPQQCPSCQGSIAIGEKDLTCSNYQCPKQKLERLLHFCDTLKLYGIGEKVMEKLINNGIINTYVDILKVGQYSNGLEDVSIVIWTKFLKQVAALPKDYHVLRGISMGYGGQKTLEKIIELLKNNEDFLNLDHLNLVNYLVNHGFTPGIGGLVSQSLIVIGDDIKLLTQWIKK